MPDSLYYLGAHETEATNTQDHPSIRLPATDDQPDQDQEFLYDMAQTPDTRHSRAASSSPLWQQVNWSLTETDSSTFSADGSASCASSSSSLPVAIPDGSADADRQSPLSPPRLAPRARRRHYTTTTTPEEDVSDISEDDDSELSVSRHGRSNKHRRRHHRQYYWTPFKGLALLFFMTAYTIFGIPEEDLELAALQPSGLELPIHEAAPPLVVSETAAERNATTNSAAATASLLRAAPQKGPGALLQMQDTNHRLQYAVKQPRGLTFKQQAEMERFYHQPALHSSLTIGRFYYAMALLGVVLWAVRVQQSHHNLRVWK